MKTRIFMIIIVIVLSVSIITGLVCVRAVQDPDVLVVLGCSWVGVFCCSMSILLLYRRLGNSHRQLQKQMDNQVQQLSDLLKRTEDDMMRESEALADTRAEQARLVDQNNNYKHLISSLRSSVRSEHTRLVECCQLLEEMRARAEQSDRLKAAFLANINHELRTPLNGILGFSSYIGMPGLSDERRKQYVDIVNDQCRRFLESVNDIAYYSKLQVGDIDTAGTVFDLNSLIYNMQNMGSLWIREHKKDLQLNVEADIPSNSFVRGFENGFIKILSNLINNAIKYTRSGTITLSCKLDGGIVTFEVADTGIGFDMAKKDLIFGSFNQSDAKLSRNYEGAGIGLSICKSLARLMNGEIHADSQPGVGSRFWVKIPVQAASNKQELDVFARVDSMLKSMGPDGEVLVMAPFDEDFDFIQSFYRPFGIQVLRSHTSEQTQQLVSEHPNITTAFIDMYSSELQGVDAAAQIFSMNPQIRTIFISDLNLTDEQMAKANVYSGIILEKPLSSYMLGKVL
ncbi:MAG: HAMP domain-containing histidine kinase [Bacteroidales bacterium]|nr:HAMP domain-containing histidine kinase [Bacteroidales bacterium]